MKMSKANSSCKPLIGYVLPAIMITICFIISIILGSGDWRLMNALLYCIEFCSIILPIYFSWEYMKGENANIGIGMGISSIAMILPILLAHLWYFKNEDWLFYIANSFVAILIILLPILLAFPCLAILGKFLKSRHGKAIAYASFLALAELACALAAGEIYSFGVFYLLYLFWIASGTLWMYALALDRGRSRNRLLIELWFGIMFCISIFPMYAGFPSYFSYGTLNDDVYLLSLYSWTILAFLIVRRINEKIPPGRQYARLQSMLINMLALAAYWFVLYNKQPRPGLFTAIYLVAMSIYIIEMEARRRYPDNKEGILYGYIIEALSCAGILSYALFRKYANVMILEAERRPTLSHWLRYRLAAAKGFFTHDYSLLHTTFPDEGTGYNAWMLQEQSGADLASVSFYHGIFLVLLIIMLLAAEILLCFRFARKHGNSARLIRYFALGLALQGGLAFLGSVFLITRNSITFPFSFTGAGITPLLLLIILYKRGLGSHLPDL